MTIDVLSIVPGRGISERDLEEMVRRELVAERERRLEAEMRVLSLRALLRRVSNLHENGHHGRAEAAIDAALSAPPPSLDAMRELVVSARKLADGSEADREGLLNAFARQLNRVLAACPSLGEGEGG